MIKAVIFDYGGVIKVAHPFFKGLSEVWGISDEDFRQTKEKRRPFSMQASKGLLDEKQYLQKVFEILGKKAPDNCTEKFKQNYRETFEFFPDIAKLIKKLREENFKTAVLSNIFRFEADVIREKHGYDGFDSLILSCEVGMMKPEPEIYSLAVNKLEIKPEECIFVDDKEENLVPANKMGMKTVLAKNPKQIIKEVLDIINFEK